MEITKPIFLLLTFAVACFGIEKCDTGAEVLKSGVSQAEKDDIVKAHNNYRTLVMEGKVPGQPKGINLKTMSYDENLGKLAEDVSKTCKFDHVTLKDDRFGQLGQNLFIEYKPCSDNSINWSKAVEEWYNEYQYFKYPEGKTDDSKMTGHYTQVVWDSSHAIGCDFIKYKAEGRCEFLYTCNYGPAGNFIGKAPYQTK